jgi:hypothetical protein
MEKQWNETPEALVREFLRDFEVWNARAVERDAAASDKIAAMDEAEDEYGDLLVKFCLPEFSGQLISYGTQSTHIATEAIVGVVIQGDKAVVKTGYTDENDFRSDYEYHAQYQDGRWYLLEAFYVDEDGKYPGL